VKAFVCVYRHPIPPVGDWEKTNAAAREDPLLQKFLYQYNNSGCYYDWGDDPSFFAARERLCSVGSASWGVCRSDVRGQLSVGDYVVFFCAKQDSKDSRIWDYYFIGCATVEHCISRNVLWNDRRFVSYREFYNVLVKVQNGKLVQHETFHKYHDNWRVRAAAPFVIFNADHSVTKINIDSPLYVARKEPKALVERWFSDRDCKVRHLEKLLFSDLQIPRRLRIPTYRNANRHIALHDAPGLFRDDIPKTLRYLRSTLLERT